VQSSLWHCAELVTLDKGKTTAGSYLRRNVKQLIKQICSRSSAVIGTMEESP